MSMYQPWVGKLDDGTEVLISLYVASTPYKIAGGANAVLTIPGATVERVESVEVAFRAKPHHTWGPPVTLELAP